jgi:hypothetical protein
MSEQSFAERLSRFTPDGTGLDRDGLLFAAGRASARPNRRWVALAGGLAACQLLTLTLLWPRPTPSVDGVVKLPAPGEVAEPTTARPAEASELWVLNRRVLLSEDGDLPPATPAGMLVPGNPPLHAFTASPPAGLE